jgi:hypothetical protein
LRFTHKLLALPMLKLKYATAKLFLVLEQWSELG